MTVTRLLWVSRRGFVKILVSPTIWRSYQECLIEADDVLAFAVEQGA
jgi:hypothetical protein